MTKISSNLRQKLIILMVGFSLCAITLMLYISQPYFVSQLDRQIYDIYLRANAGGEPSPAPAIIDIDEASLDAYGQWPWPRHMIASLLQIATESGAAAIGLDIMFAEPDRTSPIVLQKSLYDIFGVEMTFNDLPPILEDNDKLFANVLQSTPSVLGSYIQFTLVNEDTGDTLNTFEIESTNLNHTTSSHSEELANIIKNLPRNESVMERMSENAIEPRVNLMQGNGIVLPLPELVSTAPLAYLNVAPDADGIIRSIPLVMQVENRLFISIGLRTLMRALNTRNIALESNEYGLCAIHVQKYRIPVSPKGIFYIPFRGGRGVYPYYSAKDILDGTIPPDELAGRVLFLGTSASGLLDIRATPFDSIYPGVENHATVVDAILSDRSITLPVWTPIAQIGLILITGIVSTIAFGFAPAVVYLLLFMLLSGASMYFSWYLYGKDIFISPLYSIILTLFTLVILLGIRFFYEAKQKGQMKKAFSRYVSPEMVKRITDKGEVILQGEEREVSLIFTDIRGFTSFSEALEPSQVVDVLNRYFTPMTRLIQSSQGTVDKFIGDAIMAFWNAPLDVKHHELKAVRTALSMHHALAELNKELQKEIGMTLRMGAGVHTGMVYVGNMGSEELLDYTCIGDNVNLSSRLEGMCSHYGVGVVISGVVARRCKHTLELEQKLKSIEKNKKHLDKNVNIAENVITHIKFILLDKVKVKGKDEAVELYLPVAEADYKLREEEFNSFILAREAYAKGEFSEAVSLFESLYNTHEDIKYYKIYLERCKNLDENKKKFPKLHYEKFEDVWVFDSK